MGCWVAALGRLKIEPEPTAELIKDYLFFSEYSCPESYRKDEVFSNPWFFDKDLKFESETPEGILTKCMVHPQTPADLSQALRDISKLIQLS